jgi:hypothetical protein
MRLDNMVLSYNLPKSLLQSLRIQQLRISASVRNVAYLTKDFKIGDPERSWKSDALADVGDPTPRTYNLSLNLTL